MPMIKFNSQTLTDIIFAYNRISSYTPEEMNEYKTTLELIRDLEDLYSSNGVKDKLIDELTDQLWSKLPQTFNSDMDILEMSFQNLDLFKESIGDLL